MFCFHRMNLRNHIHLSRISFFTHDYSFLSSLTSLAASTGFSDILSSLSFSTRYLAPRNEHMAVHYELPCLPRRVGNPFLVDDRLQSSCKYVSCCNIKNIFKLCAV